MWLTPDQFQYHNLTAFWTYIEQLNTYPVLSGPLGHHTHCLTEEAKAKRLRQLTTSVHFVKDVCSLKSFTN